MNGELQELIGQIKEQKKNVAINKVDEVNVMKSMLNDKDFKLSIYDKRYGVVGTRCPREEAEKFVKNVISGATGLDSKDSKILAEGYEFTKKDANFMLNNMRDFISVYMSTGRKLNLVQGEDIEANIYARKMNPSSKHIPDKNNPGKSKRIDTPAFTKLVSQSKCPRYNIEEK